MDDPTDTTLAIVTGIGLFLCAIVGCWAAWRSGQHRNQIPSMSGGMKTSPSMEHLALEIPDDASDPASNNV